MTTDLSLQDMFLKPGYIYLPAQPAQLRTVVASGVVVTLFDMKRKFGGMSHYLRPFREKGLSTAVFAAPAITALTKMFFDAGSHAADIEAHFYGGAVNPDSPGYTSGLSEKNVKVGHEILSKMGIGVCGSDTGGKRARKIVFHTGTGEIMMAKVEAVRESDWYPPLNETT